MENGNIDVSWNKNPAIDLLGYNIFLNKEWVGTVDENATSYIINKNKFNIPKGVALKVAVEPFDYDGETSKTRTKVKI